MNAIMRAVTVVAMASVLLGCATAAQQQLQGMAAGNRVAMQSYQACAAAIYNQPELEPLRRDLPLGSPSLEQLANPNLVTDVETRLILANHPKLQVCRQQLISELSQSMPTVVPIFVKTTTTEDNYLIELLQKKLRWGEFLQRVRQAVNERNAAIGAESQRLIAGLQQAHEAELERRQAAVQALGNALAAYGQTQQAIARMNQPVNCTTMTIQPGFSTTNCY